MWALPNRGFRCAGTPDLCLSRSGRSFIPTMLRVPSPDHRPLITDNLSSQHGVIHITDSPSPNLLNSPRDIEGVVSLMRARLPHVGPHPRLGRSSPPPSQLLHPLGFLTFPGT